LDVVRRQLRAEIAKHQKTKSALTEAAAELQTLSYTLAHDLRAPLRAMNCFAHLVLRNDREHITPDSRDCLERVMSASERMDALICDLFTRCRVCKEATQIEDVDLDSLVRALLNEHPVWPPPRVDLYITSPLLPVRGHRGLLGQCLAQLLENASKFVAPDTRPEIRVWTEKARNQVRIWVADNGIGIPKSAQEIIFRMFQKLEQGGASASNGIGLAIVRKAMERMNGSCGVVSEPGKGSRFWLELPAVEARPAPGSVAKSLTNQPASPIGGGE
jgi:signal transduction histidine kinase